ncbi:MAG: ECF transporter S component [Bacillota bacterium]
MIADPILSIRLITRTGLLLAMTLAIQSLRLPPPVTGPLVNLILILSTALVGAAGGVGLGLITPWAALLLGILSPLLAPAVPFIMAGNALYCSCYGLLKDRGVFWPLLGLAAGSLGKFLVIAGAVHYLLNLPAAAAQALLLPQLFNALLGGAAALPVAVRLKHTFKL